MENTCVMTRIMEFTLAMHYFQYLLLQMRGLTHMKGKTLSKAELARSLTKKASGSHITYGGEKVNVRLSVCSESSYCGRSPRRPGSLCYTPSRILSQGSQAQRLSLSSHQDERPRQNPPQRPSKYIFSTGQHLQK